MVLLHVRASGLYILVCTDSVLHQQQAPCAPEERRQTSQGKQVMRRTSLACHGIICSLPHKVVGSVAVVSLLQVFQLIARYLLGVTEPSSERQLAPTW